jgi:hypothetical protein
MKSPVKIGTKFINFSVLFIVLFMANCRKNNDDPKATYPTLGQVAFTEVKATSARANCTIAKVGVGTDGSSTIKEYGICYAVKENPTISDTKLKAGDKTDKPLDFSVFISGLTAATKYFVRGYVLHEGDPVYSEQVEFTTGNLVIPEVTTGAPANVSTTSLNIAGKIVSVGTGDVSQHGHVISETNPTPSLADGKTELGAANTPKDFTSGFAGLKANTTYYIRAYATNATGTGYGAAATVKTANEIPPTVTTGDVSNITTNTATVGMNITAVGTNTNITAGVCWSSSNQTPTTADTKTSIGANTTQFFSNNLTNLTPNTTYYVRGYATTTAGTGYGDVKSFKTTLIIPTVETTPNPTFNTSPNLESDEARITLLGTVVTKGVPILEYGFVVQNSNLPNPTIDSYVLKVVSNSSISSSNGAVIGGEIKKADIAKLEATNNFRAYIRTADGVYYGSNQTFSYTYPPEFSSLKFDCNGTSFFVTKYSRTPQIVEIGEIVVFSSNYTLVTPLKLPGSTSYTEKQYSNIPSGDSGYSLYVYNTTGKLISLLPSANGKVYTSNFKIEAGNLQTVCWSYPWRLVIPYAKMANGTVYYPNPPSIKPIEKCFIDCTVK